VAGLALAALVAWATPRVVRAEAAWRQRNGFDDPWPVSPWFSRPRKPATV
jgi:hypothetical protein